MLAIFRCTTEEVKVLTLSEVKQEFVLNLTEDRVMHDGVWLAVVVDEDGSLLHGDVSDDVVGHASTVTLVCG